jgi:hypothetical protein
MIEIFSCHFGVKRSVFGIALANRSGKAIFDQPEFNAASSAPLLAGDG